MTFVQDATFLRMPSPTPSGFASTCQSTPKDVEEITREQASIRASQLIEEIAVLDRLKRRLVEELDLMQEILENNP